MDILHIKIEATGKRMNISSMKNKFRNLDYSKIVLIAPAILIVLFLSVVPLIALSAGSVLERAFAVAHFEPVPAVDRLDVKDIASGQPKNSFDGRCHVLVHSVRELDDDDRAFAWGPHQPSTYGA